MKLNSSHNPYGEPRTINMSEQCFDDSHPRHGFVAHDNKTTWSKPQYTQTEKPSRKGPFVVAIIGLCIVIALITGMFFACSNDNSSEKDTQTPVISEEA